MQVAPYSYDFLDNLGRKSPKNLIPGLEKLDVGQRIAFILELVDFKENRHLTIMIKKKSLASIVLGVSAASYFIVPKDPHECRLLVKLIIRYPRGPVGWLTRLLLPLGDLIMMRRQLLNFKRLAEAAHDVK